jgi:hypothetical protein
MVPCQNRVLNAILWDTMIFDENIMELRLNTRHLLSGATEAKTGVDIGVQVNLCGDFVWPVPLELKLKEIVDGYGSKEFIDELLEVERAVVANDNLKAENNTMIAILESSIRQREALKIELDRRDEEIKNHRLAILHRRKCFGDRIK